METAWWRKRSIYLFERHLHKGHCVSLVFRLSQRNNLRQSSTVGDRKKSWFRVYSGKWCAREIFFFFFRRMEGGGGDYAKELCKGRFDSLWGFRHFLCSTFISLLNDFVGIKGNTKYTGKLDRIVSLHMCSICFTVGKTFSKKETFGAFPLQVQGYGDLHDSLEGAMAQVEIEPVGPEGSQKSGQEVGYIGCNL